MGTSRDFKEINHHGNVEQMARDVATRYGAEVTAPTIRSSTKNSTSEISSTAYASASTRTSPITKEP